MGRHDHALTIDRCIDLQRRTALYLFVPRWIPMKYREAQTDFFGKRGVSWHITVVSRKKKQMNDMNITDESDDPSDYMDQSSSPSDDSDNQSFDRSSAGKLIYGGLTWVISCNREIEHFP